ncbi:MAG: PQQ-binding-like beta-propeller repeat protein [Myxococcales bacterium]
MKRARGAAVLAALALWAGAAWAADAERVHVLELGRSAALAASEGLDASNSYRSRVPFPKSPELTLRTRLPRGIGQAPASDEAGNLFIVHSEPQLSKLDGKARTLWSERLPSEASGAPVLLSDGSVLVITREAEALSFSRAGKRLQRSRLPFGDPRRKTLAIATESGGALVVSGNELVELDAATHILRQTQLRGNASALLASNADLIAVSEAGVVERAHATGDFELVGSFSGAVSDGAAVQAGKLFAIVDAHKWLALDLASGQVRTLAVDPASTLSGPATLLETRGAALIADNGFISERDRDGIETLRVAIGNAGPSFDPLARGLRGARLIGDASGAIIAVQAGNDALWLSPEGTALRFEGTSCLDPLRPTPTPSAVFLSCRSGQLFALSGKAP